MNLFLKIAGVLLLVCLGASCSSVRTCSKNKNYRIEYSSGGGFTGIESVITIKCDGSVIFWKRKLNSLPSITDSMALNSKQLDKFDVLMKNNDIFTYKNDFKGNYTAQLTISNDDNKNNFSFNPSELPNNMSNTIKNIISEIKTIGDHK